MNASAPATRGQPRGRILIVDDEPLKRITLQIELTEEGYEVYEAADAETARRIFASKPVDLVVSDVRMPGMNGLDLVTCLKQQNPDVPIILMTAYATVDMAVQAIKRGACDYLTKPFTTQELLARLDPLLTSRRPADAQAEVETFGRVVTRAAPMRRLFEQLRSAAATDRTILLVGESGTGKELLSEAIHAHSPRAGRPLIRFSCAALQPTVLESELFGHAKGAFTGAHRQKAGRFELASTGTILLDEVDDIPLDLQVKLLRVVEQQEFERVGGEEAIRVDVRLICATKCDLLPLVRAGRFREDLYYRLNVIGLTIPPLRERPEDIPLLVQHFLAKHAQLAGGAEVTVTPAALDELLRHNWPGNVRELEHVLERALAFCEGQALRPEHILPLGSESAEAAPALPPGDGLGETGLTETVADIEKKLIVAALQQNDGNQARAAQKLGIPRTTLRDKMAKYCIPGG